MAMTKKERGYVTELEEALLISRAFKFTPEVLPDVPPPKGIQALTKGFLYNAYSQQVRPSCSSATGHNFGDDTKTTTQEPRNLYSTKKLALMAMRHVVEIQYAKQLAEIDKKIAIKEQA